MRHLKDNLLIIVLAVSMLLGWFVPWGKVLAELGLVPYLIAAVFVCQGANLEASRFRNARQYAKLVALGAPLALLVAPALGLLGTSLAGFSEPIEVGFLLMCCMGPTLVSGVVISAQAGGERESATLLTIVLTLLSVVTIPLTLTALTGAGDSLDRVGLLAKLVTIVLLPALAGQLVRLRWPAAIARAKGALAIVPVLLLGITVYLALSEHAGHLRAVPFGEVLVLVVPSLLVHYALFAGGYVIARKLLDRPATQATSLAIVVSQKTLPVAIAIWSTELAERYPLALLPPMVFHAAQVYCDSLLARPWAKRMARRTEVAPP